MARVVIFANNRGGWSYVHLESGKAGSARWEWLAHWIVVIRWPTAEIEVQR